MARILLIVGVLLTGGAAFVANDAAKMAVNDPDYVFDLQEYAGKLPERIQTTMTQDVMPRIAGLPGAAKEMAMNWNSGEESGTVEASNRLGGIKDRNSVQAREGMTGEDIANMSAVELYKNREKVMGSMSKQINKQMGGLLK